MSHLANPIPSPTADVQRAAKAPGSSTGQKLQRGNKPGLVEPRGYPPPPVGGQSLADSLRQEFEPFFRHDLARVRIHTDATASTSAASLGADAFAHGHHIAFAKNRFRPETVGGRRLLAHELAHVVQQGFAAPVTDPKELPVHFEREADQAASAFLAGQAMPRLSTSHPGLACAPVKTNGGEFDTDIYAPTNIPPKRGGTVGKRVGANIQLRFKPNELVEADLIGMVQSVTNMKNKKAGGPIDTLNTPTANVAARSLGKRESDPGRHIDQTDRGTGKKGAPNTSPLYATNARTGAIPKSLTDAVPAIETVGSGAGYGQDTFGEHGYRKKKADGSYEVKNASLEDHPFSTIAFPKQEITMTFEATALGLSGPMANTYLGSVEWGWKCDATGTATLQPPAIRLISPGLPSGAFVDASKKWNSAKTIKDPKSRKKLDTVDLPLPTSATETSSKQAADRTTGELLLSLGAVEKSLTTARAVDKNAKTLEKRAMEQSLASRQVVIDVNVRKTEDWTGADEVYALVGASGKREKTPVKSLNDGQSGNFTLPLPSLMPIDGPITVQIFDEDSGTFFDQDDMIVNMPWLPPYGPLSNTRSLDEAEYDVSVRFNK